MLHACTSCGVLTVLYQDIFSFYVCNLAVKPGASYPDLRLRPSLTFVSQL